MMSCFYHLYLIEVNQEQWLKKKNVYKVEFQKITEWLQMTGQIERKKIT